MGTATSTVAVGMAVQAIAEMRARELADVKRRITQLLDVDERAVSDDETSLVAAAAADTFNAEASDSRLLLAAAAHELRAFGVICGALASALRERAELRDARRIELVSRHGPLLY
jgi:hypothetical protein